MSDWIYVKEYISVSLTLSGHPKTEKGNNAEENQVSSTSGSEKIGEKYSFVFYKKTQGNHNCTEYPLSHSDEQKILKNTPYN